MMEEESLDKKIWDGICPVPECNCFHQDEHDWVNCRDLKEAVQKLKRDVCICNKGVTPEDCLFCFYLKKRFGELAR